MRAVFKLTPQAIIKHLNLRRPIYRKTAYAWNHRQPIYTFWHNRVFASIYFWQKRGIVVMTSKSFDGEYIARFIQRFGAGAARGSSTRGGTTALAEMVRLLRLGYPAAFTIDGPKGPRYVAKMGGVLLAYEDRPGVAPSFHDYDSTLLGGEEKLGGGVPLPFTRAPAWNRAADIRAGECGRGKSLGRNEMNCRQCSMNSSDAGSRALPIDKRLITTEMFINCRH